MRTKSILGLLICIALVFSLSVTPSACDASADEEEVLEVMTDWFKAFNTNDYELMASLWWPSSETSQFGPNKSDAFLKQGGELIGEYWKSTFEAPVGTFTLTSHNPQVTMLGDNVAVITNYCISTYTDPTTNVQTIGQLRATFVVQKVGGKWLIVHEHSSYFPTE